MQAALNMGAASLAKDLAPAGVCVQVIHPGMVDTDMTAQWGGGTIRDCLTLPQLYLIPTLTLRLSLP